MEHKNIFFESRVFLSSSFLMWQPPLALYGIKGEKSYTFPPPFKLKKGGGSRGGKANLSRKKGGFGFPKKGGEKNCHLDDTQKGGGKSFSPPSQVHQTRFVCVGKKGWQEKTYIPLPPFGWQEVLFCKSFFTVRPCHVTVVVPFFIADGESVCRLCISWKYKKSRLVEREIPCGDFLPLSIWENMKEPPSATFPSSLGDKNKKRGRGNQSRYRIWEPLIFPCAFIFFFFSWCLLTIALWEKGFFVICPPPFVFSPL